MGRARVGGTAQR